MQLKYKMKVVNKSEKNNELLSRREFMIDLEFEGATPNKKDTKVEICKNLKLDEKLSVVRKVDVGFKSNIAKVEVLTYSDEASMKRIENYLMHKKIKEKLKKQEEEEKAVAEAKAKEEAEKVAAKAEAKAKEEAEKVTAEAKEEPSSE